MVAFSDRLFIGQRWRHKRTGVEIEITQIHRKDRLVEAKDRFLEFHMLRLYYEPITLYVQNAGDGHEEGP